MKDKGKNKNKIVTQVKLCKVRGENIFVFVKCQGHAGSNPFFGNFWKCEGRAGKSFSDGKLLASGLYQSTHRSFPLSLNLLQNQKFKRLIHGLRDWLRLCFDLSSPSYLFIYSSPNERMSKRNYFWGGFLIVPYQKQSIWKKTFTVWSFFY